MENRNTKVIIAVLVGAKKIDTIDFDYIFDKYKDDFFTVPVNVDEEFDMIFDLLSSMVYKGATNKELKDVVVYSYVVLDAKKHFLNHKKAYYDLKIDKMIERYLKED